MTILTQALAQKLVDEQGLDVVIPDIYTSIADIAFFRVGITSVRIPNSVSSIGIGAFAENQLTSIDIPNSVESVGRAAFEYNKITNASINNGIKSIGDSAFAENFLKSILITPFAPRRPLWSDSVVHKYQYSLGPQRDPVPERCLPA